MGQPTVSSHRVACESKIEAIEQLGEHPATERRILQVGGHDYNLAFGVDAHLQCMAKVRVRQKGVQHFQVVRHPAIVVAEIRDRSAMRVLQGLMAIDLTLARGLGKIEKPNAAISRRRRSAMTARVGSATPSPTMNNSKSCSLCCCTLADPLAQRFDVLVRRDQYRGGRHWNKFLAWRLPSLRIAQPCGPSNHLAVRLTSRGRRQTNTGSGACRSVTATCRDFLVVRLGRHIDHNHVRGSDIVIGVPNTDRDVDETAVVLRHQILPTLP